MKKRFLILAASVAILLPVAQSQDQGKESGHLIWKSNLYGKLGERPMHFGPKCILMEEGGKRFVRKKSDMAFNNNFRYLGGDVWGDTELRFSFRFPEKVNDINIIIKRHGFRETVKYEHYNVTIAQRNITLGGTKDLDKDVQDKPSVTVKLLPELGVNQWYRAMIRAENNTVKFYMEKDGKMSELASAEVFPGGGGMQINSKDVIDLADIEIIELKAVPKVYPKIDENGKLIEDEAPEKPQKKAGAAKAQPQEKSKDEALALLKD